MDSDKLGFCIVGEHLIGIARKIFKFNNPFPIISINTSSCKMQRHGGKKPYCFVNKGIRETKIDPATQMEYKFKIKVFIEEKFKSKMSIFEDKGNSIEGNELICECKDCEKKQNIKKVSHFSASHSADCWDFFGDYTIAYVDLAFTQSKAIRLIE